MIGIGGTGSRVLQALKARLDARGGLAHGDAIQLLLLDIDREAIKDALEGSRGARLQADETFLLSLHRPQEYQTRSADLLQWISRRWLYNIPRTLTTQGFRPLGRLAWVDHAAKVSAALRDRITRLITDESIQALETAGGLPCRNRFPRVILVGSTSGGTAGGMMLDVVQAVRHCLAAMNLPDDGLRQMLIHSTNRHPRESVLAAANTYAFLSELQHYCLSPHVAPADPKRTGTRTGGSWSAPPITYFVNLGERLSEDAYDERIATVADYLYCDTATCAALRSTAVARLPRPRPSTICTSVPSDSRPWKRETASCPLVGMICSAATSCTTGSRRSRPISNSHPDRHRQRARPRSRHSSRSCSNTSSVTGAIPAWSVFCASSCATNFPPMARSHHTRATRFLPGWHRLWPTLPDNCVDLSLVSVRRPEQVLPRQAKTRRPRRP